LLRPPLTCICSGHLQVGAFDLGFACDLCAPASALSLLPRLEDYFAAFRTLRNNAAIPISNTVTSIPTDV
jgi:hypothetical protein